MTRWPRKHEQVFVQSREECGEYPLGTVSFTQRDRDDIESSRVYVFFDPPPPSYTKGEWRICYEDQYIYKYIYDSDEGETYIHLYEPIERTEKLDRSKLQYVWFGQEYNMDVQPQELIEFWFSDFEGNWSSNDGGNGRWEIE